MHEGGAWLTAVRALRAHHSLSSAKEISARRERGRAAIKAVRVKIMGSKPSRKVGESQSVLIVIGPVISTRRPRGWMNG
jgi:hypothetical protein